MRHCDESPPSPIWRWPTPKVTSCVTQGGELQDHRDTPEISFGVHSSGNTCDFNRKYRKAAAACKRDNHHPDGERHQSQGNMLRESQALFYGLPVARSLRPVSCLLLWQFPVLFRWWQWSGAVLQLETAIAYLGQWPLRNPQQPTELR